MSSQIHKVHPQAEDVSALALQAIENALKLKISQKDIKTLDPAVALKRLFKRFDMNGNGTLCRSEFCSAVQQLIPEILPHVFPLPKPKYIIITALRTNSKKPVF